MRRQVSAAWVDLGNRPLAVEARPSARGARGRSRPARVAWSRARALFAEAHRTVEAAQGVGRVLAHGHEGGKR